MLKALTTKVNQFESGGKKYYILQLRYSHEIPKLKFSELYYNSRVNKSIKFIQKKLSK